MTELLTEEQDRCIVVCNLNTATVTEPCDDKNAEKGVCDRTYQNCVEECLKE